MELLTSKGMVFAPREMVEKNNNVINHYKVCISKLTSEHAGMPDKNGKYKIISKNLILLPEQVCNQS